MAWDDWQLNEMVWICGEISQVQIMRNPADLDFSALQ